MQGDCDCRVLQSQSLSFCLLLFLCCLLSFALRPVCWSSSPPEQPAFFFLLMEGEVGLHKYCGHKLLQVLAPTMFLLLLLLLLLLHTGNKTYSCSCYCHCTWVIK